VNIFLSYSLHLVYHVFLYIRIGHEIGTEKSCYSTLSRGTMQLLEHAGL